jgi:hypothetical protein
MLTTEESGQVDYSEKSETLAGFRAKVWLQVGRRMFCANGPEKVLLNAGKKTGLINLAERLYRNATVGQL